MKIVPRTAAKAAAVVVVAGLAVTACGSVKMGAAAIVGNTRISSATLTAQVRDLSAAYRADKAKGISPQRNTGQETEQVLSWLITFRIYDKIAANNHINVTPAQAAAQLADLSSEAKQSKATLAEYVSAAGALPPDLTPQLGRYFAILTTLEKRITGGKAPTTESTALQRKVATDVAHDQCVASKNLAVTVNPQYGVFDYNTYSVVPATSKLSAQASPSASATPARTTPPC